MDDIKKFKLVRGLWIAMCLFPIIETVLVFFGIFVPYIAPIGCLIVFSIQIGLGYRSKYEIFTFIWMLALCVFLFTWGLVFGMIVLFSFVPLGCLGIFLIERRHTNSFGYKRYNSKSFRGMAQDPITFVNSDVSGLDLYNQIKEGMAYELSVRNIPARLSDAETISGSLATGTVVPMLIIKNPDCRYFDLGIAVNNKTVIFPLLGESAENTKANKSEYYAAHGQHFKAAFNNADDFKLQQEAVWRQSVIACFNSLCE